MGLLGMSFLEGFWDVLSPTCIRAPTSSYARRIAHPKDVLNPRVQLQLDLFDVWANLFSNRISDHRHHDGKDDDDSHRNSRHRFRR